MKYNDSDQIRAIALFTVVLAVFNAALLFGIFFLN